MKQDNASRYKVLEQTLEAINGSGCSGGLVSFEDLAFFERIKPSESVLYHHTKWLPTNLGDEQTQFIVLQRVRKAMKDATS